MDTIIKRNNYFYIDKIIKLGAPLLAGNLSHYLYHISDSAMVGWLGADSLGAIAIASTFCWILTVILWPLTLGVQAIASRRWGRHLEEKNAGNNIANAFNIGAVLDNALVVGFVFSAVAFFGSFTAFWVLPKIMKDKQLITLCFSYISIYKWSLPSLAIYFIIMGFFSAIHKTRDIMIANIGGNILNVILNYIFIFGKLGFPAMGIKGAALGTVIASTVAVIYFIILIFNPAIKKKFNVIKFNKLHFQMMINIIKTALPVSIQNCIALAVFLAYKIIIGNNIGIYFLGATHIAFSMFRISKTIVGGFARGASILVGNHLGVKKTVEAEKTIIGCELIACIVGIFIVAITLIFPEQIVCLFTKDSNVISIGIKALQLFAVFFFIEVLGYSFETIFTGNGWGHFVLFSEFTTNILFILLSTFICVKILGLGIYSAWISFIMYQIFHAIILFFGFISGKWKHIDVEKGL